MEELERSVKSWCPDSVCYVTVAYADIESLKYHLQFFDKYLCHRLAKFEHYRMIQTT